MPSAALEIQGLSARYGEAQALRDVSLHVGEGELVTLVGRTGASVLLLDEPTEGLAPVLVQRVASMLQEAKREGTTVLLVEQNLRFATTVADRHYLLAQGQIVEALANQEVIARESELLRHLGV